MKLNKLDETQIESIVSKAIQDAVDFIDDEIEPQRIKAQRYFDAEVDIGHEQGRSGVVATKCREVVRGLKPSIQRIFLNNEKPVEFVPRGPEDVKAAEQATSYISYKFHQHNGYRILNDVFQDAMVKKTGIAYVYYNEQMRPEIHTYTGLNDEEFALIVEDDEVEVIEHEETTTEIVEEGMGVAETIHDVKISRMQSMGDLCIESLPPEDFFIDRNARSIDDYYVCGHTSEKRIADLLAMGFDLEDLRGLEGDDYSSLDDETEFQRRGYSVDHDDDENISVSSKKITVTIAYMELDIEGTGMPRLYQFTCAGGLYKLLDYTETDYAPYAIFECDPESHAFFGTSLVDLVLHDQDAATAMLRGVLDNVALTNNPGLQVVEGQAAIDDLLNNEIGRIVRVTNPNAIREMVVPFTAGSTLPALQYFDQLVDNKTGVSKMAQGLDPDVLKSTTATAIAASQEGQTGQAEVIARNFAEGGMKQMFKLMLKCMIKNTNKQEMMRLNGDFVPIDAKDWDADMDMSVNVGIGTGRENDKMAVLQQMLQIQQTIYQQYGNQNGLVSLTQIRNTIADIMGMAGIRNSDRYVAPMTVEIEQAMLQMQMQQQAQMAQMQPQQADPNQMFMQAEAMKSQMDMQKAAMNNQYKMHELGMKDDLERDKMVQELAVKVAEILGKYGTAVDVEEIKSEQNAVREHNAEMMGMNGGYRAEG